jgi:putative phosphoesterase
MPRGGRSLPAGSVRLLEAADLALHVGDVTSAEVLEELRRLCPVEAVRGNMDAPALRAALPERRVVEAEGCRFGLVHDPGPAAGRHERLVAWFPRCDIVVFGHTHLPEVSRHAGVWIVNPGSPTERRRARGHTMAAVRGGLPALVDLD